MDIRLNAVAEEYLRCALRTWLALVNRYGYIGDYEVLQHLIDGRLRVSRDNKDYTIVVDNGTDNEEYASYLVYTARRCGGGYWQLQLEQAATIVPVFDTYGYVIDGASTKAPLSLPPIVYTDWMIDRRIVAEVAAFNSL